MGSLYRARSCGKIRPQERFSKREIGGFRFARPGALLL